MRNYLLFGNPNVGKTSVFNYLTNSNEHVSNFEGVTVARKSAKFANSDDFLVDIPGVYSINAFSLADDVSQQALLNEQIDGIIDVINICDLKRNLYLLIDLIETGKPVNAILNMNDLFKGQIDVANLSSALSINFTRSANNDYANTLTNITSFQENTFLLDYGKHFEAAINELEELIISDKVNLAHRFYAIQFLQGDDSLVHCYHNQELALEIKAALKETIVSKKIARSASGHVFNVRRNMITNLLNDNYTLTEEIDEMPFMNNVFDKFALHKYFGFVIFTFVMWLVFFVAVKGGFLQDVVDGYVSAFSDFVANTLTAIGSPEFFTSFIVDGAIAGVGGVVVFLPQIIILFAMLTIFESIGYFARVNALFENLFNKIGISSSSMIPFISGFGCNVIGIMGTRTITNEKKRIATILASPFISCSARLPVYLIFVEIFFDKHQELVLLFLYLLGIFVAITVAFVIDKILYNDDEVQTILPLPKYKRVKVNYFARLTWIKVKSFITKAGTLIFLGSIGLWFFSYLGWNGYTTDISQSFVSDLGNHFAWIFSPLGFGTVQAFSAIVVSFLAKELAVSALIVMYGATGIDSLSPILQNEFTAASALSFMVFILLYIPCLATLGAIYSETKSIKYVIYSIAISLSIGYVLAFITYHLALIIL